MRRTCASLSSRAAHPPTRGGNSRARCGACSGSTSIRRLCTLRFTALWRTGSRPGSIFSEVGEFDATGPLASSLRPLRDYLTYFAADPAGPTFYAAASQALYRVDLARYQSTLVGDSQSNTPLEHCGGIAFDTKRRRLAFASKTGAGSITFYSPDDGTWAVSPPLANIDLVSLAYSEAEDRFYGIMDPSMSDRPSIVRFTPAGAPEWRIPLPGGVPKDENGTVHFAPPQLVAVGELLVVILPGRSEPYGGPEAVPPRCVVFDPKTMQVKYSGDMEVRKEGP